MKNAIAALFLMTLAAGCTFADPFTTYNYTGNAFTNVNGPYTTSDFVTLSVTLTSPLPTNSPLTWYRDCPSTSPVCSFSWVGSDGYIEEIDGSSSAVVYFATANGAITAWDVEFADSDEGEGIGTVSGNEDYGKCQSSDCRPMGFGTGPANGTWTGYVVAPEPSTLATMGLGVLLLAGSLYRRVRLHSSRQV